MTKVEELRGSMEEAIRCYDVFGDHKISLAMSDMIIGLIAAARAEGAEAERERILVAMRERHDEGLIDSPYHAVLSFVSAERASLLAPATKSVPSATVTNHGGPVTSTDCSIENAGYVQTSDKEPK